MWLRDFKGSFPMEAASDQRLELVNCYFSGTGKTYDAMVWYATLGIDGRWKGRIVDSCHRVLSLSQISAGMAN